MFALFRSNASVGLLALGAVLLVFPTCGDVWAQENTDPDAKAVGQDIGVANPSPQSVQMATQDSPQDKEVIAFIKGNSRINFKIIFPSDWEAICFSGEYQHPIRDIKYELGKDFSACTGSYRNFRDDGVQAISVIWSNRCRIIDVSTSRFFVERQNGTSCYRRDAIKEFSLQQSPVGMILVPLE
jgi:hypothetical protein